MYIFCVSDRQRVELCVMCSVVYCTDRFSSVKRRGVPPPHMFTSRRVDLSPCEVSFILKSQTALCYVRYAYMYDTHVKMLCITSLSVRHQL